MILDLITARFYKQTILCVIRADTDSFVLAISHNGLHRCNTGRPQPEVDYDEGWFNKHMVKIIGIDIL